MLHLSRTTSENADFQMLVEHLDRYLAEIDGTEHAFYAQYNSIARLQYVVVAYQDDEAVGCGAFKELAPGTVEMKRMFVLPTQRRQGIAQDVLAELERWAAELHYPTAVLETGRRQAAAVALYEQAGYAPIPNYGQYVGVDNSVCFRKELV